MPAPPDLSSPALATVHARAAALAFAGRVHRTPLLACASLSDRAGVPLLLKCENLQRAGSFKIRGALTKILSLTAEQTAAGIVAHSSGNHAQGVALAASLLGARATIVMPTDAVRSKVEATRGYGAEVVFAGTTSEERAAEAYRLAAERGQSLVLPFDDPMIIVGQGTVALEILAECPAPSAIFIPIGGGGLLSGVALVSRELSAHTKVIGVEPTGCAKVSVGRAAGRRRALERFETIADGLRPLAVGVNNWDVIDRFVDDVVTVSDHEILNAMRLLIERVKLVVEPSGAASVAAALREASRYGAGPAVAVISGGNVDGETIALALATSLQD